MPLWEGLVDVLVVVLALVALAMGFLFARRRWLSRGGATFECSLRTSIRYRQSAAASARGWTLGVARYSQDSLEWFRVFSFLPRPRHVFSRPLRVVGRRQPEGAEAFAIYAGHQVVEVELDGGGRAELAMSEAALTGFLAWIEAAPPGDVRRLA